MLCTKIVFGNVNASTPKVLPETKRKEGGRQHCGKNTGK